MPKDAEPVFGEEVEIIRELAREEEPFGVRSVQSFVGLVVGEGAGLRVTRVLFQYLLLRGRDAGGGQWVDPKWWRNSLARYSFSDPTRPENNLV